MFTICGPQIQPLALYVKHILNNPQPSAVGETFNGMGSILRTKVYQIEKGIFIDLIKVRIIWLYANAEEDSILSGPKVIRETESD